MNEWIATGLAEIEAESEVEAREFAENTALPWMVAGVLPACELHNPDPVRPRRRLPFLAARRRSRPLFGKAALIGVPIIVIDAVTDQSAIHSLVDRLPI